MTLLAVGLLLAAFCVWQGEMIVYGAGQGIGQAKVILESRPVEEVLADDQFPDSLKAKLHLVQEIREFAIDSLGINDSENYKSVYDQHGKPILWVVSGCPPYQLEAHKWDYPFLGALGYKGFFDLEKAKREERELQKMSLDTDVGEVGAWSTLGWFNDPILSSMLNKSPGSLARLIIHELTHATLYVSGNADYNENLATFVGDNGAILFLKSKYGVNSKEYKDYMGRLADIELYSAHVLGGAMKLDSLYETFDEHTPEKEKSTGKEGMIRHIISSSDTLNFYNASRYARIRKADFLPNNTFFMSFKMYREEQSVFEKEFREEFDSNFQKYLTYLKSKYPHV